ncbi:hypothetical protein EUTSA_v10022157mg [Eutrema salsugineum]|uniref:MADS-box domain-containing protein n=1 Tax=Eutrema salsugineum TaxID=72664 RepID=V4NQI0_EUTSA|nr:agamous-like MADS-box protein AGL17 [Eutrema salsugineum]ESQ48861.1 hypothetical protein EUTSA_v10022157mg [Eutrema salsugineum]
MTRKKIRLAWVENENSRAVSLKKRRLGLVKKVRELTILCDVKACMILFSPDEVEPMVWPSVAAARDLLDEFSALPDVVKKKKETSLESYLKEKTRKIHEKLKKSHKKNTEYVINQLMMQLRRGREIADLDLSEIYGLLSFSKDKIMHFRKRLNLVQRPPLREPPMYPFEAQSEELRTTANDIFTIRGGQYNEGAMNIDEAAKRISIGTVRENQSHYLMDQWIFPSSEPPIPQGHQQIGMGVASYNANPVTTRCYLAYQGSSSIRNPNLEMEPIGPPATTFHGLVGSVSQPLQLNHNMNNNPIMAMSQPRQYPFDSMSRQLGVKEEGSNINNGDSQFHWSSNTMTTNDGLHQEPPPPNEATAGEGNVDATSFDVNRVWPGNNSHHF